MSISLTAPWRDAQPVNIDIIDAIIATSHERASKIPFGFGGATAADAARQFFYDFAEPVVKAATPNVLVHEDYAFQSVGNSFDAGFEAGMRATVLALTKTFSDGLEQELADVVNTVGGTYAENMRKTIARLQEKVK